MARARDASRLHDVIVDVPLIYSEKCLVVRAFGAVGVGARAVKRIFRQ